MLCWALFLLGGGKMFVHVLKIPTSSINHTWDVFIKHVCIDTKKIHVCITSLPLHIVFFCAIPSRPNHPNFRTKKYTPQKKHTKTQLFSYNHPTSEKKKNVILATGRIPNSEKKQKKHDTLDTFPGTHRRFENHPKIGVSGRVRSTLGPYLSSK